MPAIIFNAPKPANADQSDLQSQVENLQTTLASLNQQVIILQETLQEKDQKIAELSQTLYAYQTMSGRLETEKEGRIERNDRTMTIVEALIHFYKFIFQPGKDLSASSTQ